MILSAMLTAGCGMMEVDWAPVEIYIEAVDAEGNSIISPHMPGMTLTFKGKTYTVRDAGAPMELQTRTYGAIMSGLVARPMDETDGQVVYHLVFGEIDGAADMDEDIRLNWPDGSEDVIHYHCSNHREWPSLDCKRSWKLNGKKHDGCVFRFSGKSLAGE
jgi:hypothetical protein